MYRSLGKQERPVKSLQNGVKIDFFAQEFGCGGHVTVPRGFQAPTVAETPSGINATDAKIFYDGRRLLYVSTVAMWALPQDCALSLWALPRTFCNILSI
jgi:hypothetical protein